jgi:tetratricopeptide (TPR) repeat protein
MSPSLASWAKVVALVALILIPGWPATAQIDDDAFRQCYHGTAPQLVILGCSAIINGQMTDKEHLAAALKGRGNAYDQIGQYQKALDDFERAIAINRGDWDALNSRGAAKSALKRLASAIEDFDRAIDLNPGSDLLYSNRCYAKALHGNLEAAIADCNEALHIKADSPSGLASRGFVYLLLKRYDEALADYEAVLADRFEDPYSLFGRGVAKHRKGDLKGADDDFVHALTLKPDIADYMAERGVRAAAP